MRGHAEHGHEQPHVAPTFARGHHVTDDGLGAHHQAAAAQSLHRPKEDQLEHGVAQSGQCRPDQKDDDGDLKEEFPPELVPEFAPQRSGDRRRQQVGGDHPGQVRSTVEVAHDGGKRGRDHCLVQSGQKHAQHECADDHQDSPMRERAGQSRLSRGKRLAHGLAPDSTSVTSEPSCQRIGRQYGPPRGNLDVVPTGATAAVQDRGTKD